MNIKNKEILVNLDQIIILIKNYHNLTKKTIQINGR